MHRVCMGSNYSNHTNVSQYFQATMYVPTPPIKYAKIVCFIISFSYVYGGVEGVLVIDGIGFIVMTGGPEIIGISCTHY